jgi:ABC-type glycerol-3-phosphate transport system substrate-binding protein
MTGKSHRILPGLALAMTLAAAGCASIGVGVTPTADIRGSPASFEGKEVTVKGTVREVTKLPIVELKSYVLADSTGEIKVTTKSAPPAKGEKLIVRGVVSSTAIVGSHSFGVHLSERERSSTF